MEASSVRMRILVVSLVTALLGVSMAGEPAKKAASLDLVMPGAAPSRDDDYLCSAFDVRALSGEADNSTVLHVTGFVPTADANKAHHMLLYSCNEPVQPPGSVMKQKNITQHE